jgi:hypothetical protein
LDNFFKNNLPNFAKIILNYSSGTALALNPTQQSEKHQTNPAKRPKSTTMKQKSNTEKAKSAEKRDRGLEKKCS